MALIDPTDVSNFIEATVTAASILGGVMAYWSGYLTANALASGQPPEIVAQRLNEGIGRGFSWGGPLSAVVLIIGAWS